VHNQCLDYHLRSQLVGSARYITGIVLYAPGFARCFWCGDEGRLASRMLGSWVVQKVGASWICVLI
jgi:hypothetical protein